MQPLPHNRVASTPCVTVIIPALDEQDGIGSVLAQIRNSTTLSGVAIVVDGHSKDNTVSVATHCQAEVVSQDGRGYGDALQTGIRYALRKYNPLILVMIDADGTYDGRDIERLVQPLLNGETDLVIGNRLAGMDPGAMTTTNQIGNLIISKLVSLIIRNQLLDTQCGLRAFRRSLAREFVSGPRGMPFAAEMIFRAARRRARILEVPVRYHRRIGVTKLNPVKDGLRIVLRIMLSIIPKRRKKLEFDDKGVW